MKKSDITLEMWEKAVSHAREMKREAEMLPSNAGIFYMMGCVNIIGRYYGGERTARLYNEMINLS